MDYWYSFSRWSDNDNFKMKTNQKGIDLIKHFEGFRAEPYICSGGKNTIGFGHVIKPKEHFKTLSLADAEVILKDDVKIAEEAVSAFVKVALNSNQFSALCSFVFNLGRWNLGRSTLLQLLNKGEYSKAADEFPKWCWAGGVKLKGLLARRKAERDLFLTESN